MKYPDDFIDKVICGDCLEVMKDIPDNSVDLVLTDPPYPNYHTDKWIYTSIDFLMSFSCRQLIFWSAILNFPLDYTAIHIWDKKINAAASSEYERIFERNGEKLYRIFNHYLINSTIAAKYNRDVWTKHPSQKPIALIGELILKYSKQNDLILDPFLGSGTTAVACKQLNRHFIGIEINPDYCKIARERLMGVPESLFKEVT